MTHRHFRTLLAIATTGSTIILAALLPSTVVHAQSATAQQGAGTTQRPPFGGQAQPVAPTPEQQRARDEAMQKFNIPGPPLPVDPSARVAPPSVPATSGKTGPTAPGPGGELQGAPPPAPNNF